MVNGQPPCSPAREAPPCRPIDVGALFAVDLDVDEEFVHHRGSVGILEALMRHDMAPMAGGVADREQDGLVGPLGFGQRRRSPRPPMDRVVLMLEQVGARLVAEPVFGSLRVDPRGRLSSASIPFTITLSVGRTPSVCKAGLMSLRARYHLRTGERSGSRGGRGDPHLGARGGGRLAPLCGPLPRRARQACAS